MFDIKIDQNISSKQRISFGFDYDNTNNESLESIGADLRQCDSSEHPLCAR